MELCEVMTIVCWVLLLIMQFYWTEFSASVSECFRSLSLVSQVVGKGSDIIPLMPTVANLPYSCKASCARPG